VMTVTTLAAHGDGPGTPISRTNVAAESRLTFREATLPWPSTGRTVGLINPDRVRVRCVEAHALDVALAP